MRAFPKEVKEGVRKRWLDPDKPSTKLLAREFSISIYTVLLYTKGLTRNKTHWPRIIELAQQGKSRAEIALEVGHSYNNVGRVLRRHGISGKGQPPSWKQRAIKAEARVKELEDERRHSQGLEHEPSSIQGNRS